MSSLFLCPLSFTIQTFTLSEKWDNKNVVYQGIILNESIQHVQKYLFLFGSPDSRRMCQSLNQALILCSPKHINVFLIDMVLGFASQLYITYVLHILELNFLIILLLIKWELSYMLLIFVTDWVKISCSTCLHCHWSVSVEIEHGCPLSLQQSSHLLCSPCSMTRQVSFACPALPLQSLCLIGSVKQQWLFEVAKRARTGQGRYTDKDGWMYLMGDIWTGLLCGKYAATERAVLWQTHRGQSTFWRSSCSRFSMASNWDTFSSRWPGESLRRQGEKEEHGGTQIYGVMYHMIYIATIVHLCFIQPLLEQTKFVGIN